MKSIIDNSDYSRLRISSEIALSRLQPSTLVELANVEGSISANLHIHTTISDGSYTFLDVLKSAHEYGLKTIAFTNHDTTKGLDGAIALGKEYGINVIGGIEISAWDSLRLRKVHILGYGLSSFSPTINSFCLSTLNSRNDNSNWQLERIREANYKVNYEILNSFRQGSTALYKQHIMASICECPFESDEYQSLYKSLFKGDGICARDIEYIDAKDAVRAIVEDGGVAVVAHPGQMDSFDVVEELVEVGLLGIEKWHPDNDEEAMRRCDELADKHGLVCTRGTDFHGEFGCTSLF